MKEAISINLGQAGVQVSNAAWELFCMEHGIRSDGSRLDALEDSDECCEIFFQQLTSTYVPRVVTVDFEPTVIDEIRLGAYRQLFHPDQLISGCEDCANNFARGNYTVGKIYLKTVMRQIVKLVENCDCLQGFLMLNSFDGGTGAGFSSCLEEALSFHYGKKPKLQLGVYPSRRMATSIVYPYNAIFHTHATMNHTDLSVLMDNEAIYNICSNKLNLSRPSYTNLNKIIAQLFSSITVSMRFKNFLNSDIDQICTNLIPYPRIHFPLSHLAPLLAMDMMDKEPCNITEMTRDIFDSDNQMVQCDTENGRFMACVMQFRGSVAPNEVNKAIHEIKRRTDIQFVDWCPTGFKVGINSKPLASPPGSSMAQIQKSLSMLSNTSAIVETWSDLLRKFTTMYSHKAFLHWFVGEGLEEAEFGEAYDDIKTLEMDYLEVSVPSNDVLIEVGQRSKSRDHSQNTQGSVKKQKSQRDTSRDSVESSHQRASKKRSSNFKDSVNDEFGPPAAGRKSTRESHRKPSSDFKDNVNEENGPPIAARKSTKESVRKSSSDFKDDNNDEKGPSIQPKLSTIDSTNICEITKNPSLETKGDDNDENIRADIDKRISIEGEQLLTKRLSSNVGFGMTEASKQTVMIQQYSKDNVEQLLRKLSSDFKEKEEFGPASAPRRNTVESYKWTGTEVSGDGNDKYGPPEALRRNTDESIRRASSYFKDSAHDEYGAPSALRRSTLESSRIGSLEFNEENGPHNSKETSHKSMSARSIEFKDCVGDEFGPPSAVRRSTQDSIKVISEEHKDNMYDEFGPAEPLRRSTLSSTRKDSSEFKDNLFDERGPPVSERLNTKDSSQQRLSKERSVENNQVEPPALIIRQNTNESVKAGTLESNAELNIEERAVSIIKQSSKESSKVFSISKKESIEPKDVPIGEHQTLNVVKQSSKESAIPVPTIRKASSNSKREEHAGMQLKRLTSDESQLNSATSKTKMVTSNIHITASSSAKERNSIDDQLIKSTEIGTEEKKLSVRISVDSKCRKSIEDLSVNIKKNLSPQQTKLSSEDKKDDRK